MTTKILHAPLLAPVVMVMLRTFIEQWENIFLIARADEIILAIVTFFMAMAMVSVGLQIRIKPAWKQDWRVIAIIFLG